MGSRLLRPLAIRRLEREVSFRHPRILHVIDEAMEEPALALADAWRIPYVQTVDAFGIFDRSFKLSKRWFRGLVVTSSDLALELEARLEFPSERISVISPGIAPGHPDGHTPSQRVPVVGTAAPATENSGLDCFLEAARMVLNSGKDAEFLIARQGEGTQDLRRHARSLQLSEHLSFVDLAALGSRIWTVLDLYCQPSLVPNTGRTLALALSQAIPCISSWVTGLNSLIDSGSTGLLVPPGDPEALATAIIKVLDDPDLAITLGRHAQAAARSRFNLEVEADLLTSLYRKHADLAPLDAGTEPE
jgi:glycosyltransferase involved in cell wall biosynthesis